MVLPPQLFPGRPPVRKLLEMLQEWLASLPLDRVPYNAVLDLVNNKMRVRPPGSGPHLAAAWPLRRPLRGGFRPCPCDACTSALLSLVLSAPCRVDSHPRRQGWFFKG